MTNNESLTAMMTAAHAATTARARLTELTTHTDCDFARSDECQHDIADEMTRDLLILDDDYEPLDRDYYRNTTTIDIDALATELTAILATLRADQFSTHFLSMLHLDHSLCPMHHCDYAACFDDDDPECATIRAFFPNHDT